jgi:hypothetical protein
MVIVRKTRLTFRNTVVYSAWTKSAADGTHHTITSFVGVQGVWGKLGTENIPAAIDTMPTGMERSAAVRAWRTARQAAARAAILAQHPEAAAGIADGAEIEMTL